MKNFGTIQFWTLYLSGILFLLTGAFLFVTGKASESTANLLMCAGLGLFTTLCVFLVYIHFHLDDPINK